MKNDDLEMKNALLSLAKRSIEDQLNGISSIDNEKLIKQFPILAQKAATFVTLTIDKKLRGCIGSLVSYNTLIDDIEQNAKKAAFGDPRFPPLTQDEFENTDIEISLLSEAVKVEYSSMHDLENKIKIGVDGMIIKQGFKQATFLPQVWEQLPSFELFMNHLFVKAGITDLDTAPEVFIYQVEKIK